MQSLFHRSIGEYPSNERQNRVIFLSDGLATVGNTSQQAIVQMATGYIERGIGLTTIGVGDSFDVLLMRGLAEFGAGNFYFVEDAAAAHAEAAAAGLPIILPLTQEPFGQKRFGFHDPSGLWVDVVEQTEPAEGFWETYAVPETAWRLPS